jgi:hypothetical protein
VGGGTGGTTAFVLAAVAEYGDSLRYVFTDVSPGFTAAARGRFASTYPFVEYALYDIERPEGEQQHFVEDCPVCCRANVIDVHFERGNFARVVAELE